MRKALRSAMLSWLLSAREQRLRRAIADLKRRCGGGRHVLRCFLQLDDPYSYLLAWFLPAIRESFEVRIDLHLAQALLDGYRPQPELYAEHALLDCERLAYELGVPFLDKGVAPPVEHRRSAMEYLSRRLGAADYDAELLQVLQHYWRGDAESIARRVAGISDSGQAESHLLRNSELLEKLGHFGTATIHYGSEWFAGIDRLHYLVERLQDSSARQERTLDSRLVSLFRAMQLDLPVAPPGTAKQLPPLELFFSFRSPYSYVGLRRFARVAGSFGIQTQIRPVLPMVMRGMQVPRNKITYFSRDSAREARRHALQMGPARDPVGSGVERCHAVFAYAETQGRQKEFAFAATEAIWAGAIDVSTDRGMRRVTDSAGLSWPDAREALHNSAWRALAESNRESMLESGCWGVPVARMGEFAVWGQDRDWLLARHLEELCDSGEGIMI